MTAASNSNSARLETPSSQPDASMEEILASIRRIIAEEQSDLSAKQTAPPAAEPAQSEAPVPQAEEAGQNPDREFDEWLAETATGVGETPPLPAHSPAKPPVADIPRPAVWTQPDTSNDAIVADMGDSVAESVSEPAPAAPVMSADAPSLPDAGKSAKQEAVAVPSPGALEIPRGAIELLNAIPSEQDRAPAITVNEATATVNQAPSVQIEVLPEQDGARPNPLDEWPDEELPVSPKLQVVPDSPKSDSDAVPQEADLQEADLNIGEEPDSLDMPIRSHAAEPLLSEMAGEEISSSFQALSQSVLMKNDAMIEAAIKEMLRPMLKQWLDDNLPPMVERLVRAEIQRVARGS